MTTALPPRSGWEELVLETPSLLCVSPWVGQAGPRLCPCPPLCGRPLPHRSAAPLPILEKKVSVIPGQGSCSLRALTLPVSVAPLSPCGVGLIPRAGDQTLLKQKGQGTLNRAFALGVSLLPPFRVSPHLLPLTLSSLPPLPGICGPCCPRSVGPLLWCPPSRLDHLLSGALGPNPCRK